MYVQMWLILLMVYLYIRLDYLQMQKYILNVCNRTYYSIIPLIL